MISQYSHIVVIIEIMHKTDHDSGWARGASGDQATSFVPLAASRDKLAGSSPLTRPLRRPAPRMVNDDCPSDALLHALVLPSLLAEICIGKSIGPLSTRSDITLTRKPTLLVLYYFMRLSSVFCIFPLPL
jgi:hypothetical protein